MNKKMIKEGKCYLISIVPGWLMAGKIKYADDFFIEMELASWIENNQKSVFELTAANPIVRKISTSVHPIHNGLNLDSRFISFVSEISEKTTKELYNFEIAEAITKA